MPKPLPRAYTRTERFARMVTGAMRYDVAKYEQFGGDAWIATNAVAKLANPGKVDEALWKKAKKASEEAFGKIKWPFVSWWYKKQGGSFK
jgi:hypothetical protein